MLSTLKQQQKASTKQRRWKKTFIQLMTEVFCQSATRHRGVDPGIFLVGDGEAVLLLQTVKAENFHKFHAVKGLFLFVNQLLRDTREVHVTFHSLRTLRDETTLSRFRQFGRL